MCWNIIAKRAYYFSFGDRKYSHGNILRKYGHKSIFSTKIHDLYWFCELVQCWAIKTVALSFSRRKICKLYSPLKVDNRRMWIFQTKFYSAVCLSFRVIFKAPCFITSNNRINFCYFLLLNWFCYNTLYDRFFGTHLIDVEQIVNRYSFYRNRQFRLSKWYYFVRQHSNIEIFVNSNHFADVFFTNSSRFLRISSRNSFSLTIRYT